MSVAPLKNGWQTERPTFLLYVPDYYKFNQPVIDD